MNKFWAYAGGLTSPCGPGVENVQPVFVNTGGPPLPRKRAQTKTSFIFHPFYCFYVQGLNPSPEILILILS